MEHSVGAGVAWGGVGAFMAARSRGAIDAQAPIDGPLMERGHTGHTVPQTASNKGPPRAALPPSPLRMVMGCFFG
jgi:hypothetical protein